MGSIVGVVVYLIRQDLRRHLIWRFRPQSSFEIRHLYLRTLKGRTTLVLGVGLQAFPFNTQAISYIGCFMLRFSVLRSSISDQYLSLRLTSACEIARARTSVRYPHYDLPLCKK